MAARTPLIAVVGTNASGKSALGVELARRLDGEVVSADSRQVYRDLDLGTGKLTAAEMRGVPHHLLDVAAVTDVYSVADFQRDAYAVIDDIEARGRRPLLVGGTGLYLDAVTEGYQLAAAPPDRARRVQLEELALDALATRLQELDPVAAAAVDPRNRRRLVRAVEVAERGVGYAETRRRQPRYDVLKLGLTWPPDVLRRRIHDRLVDRLAHGLVGEVRALLAAGVPTARLDELGLEYRFVLRHVEGGDAGDEKLTAELGAAIFRFARRQQSWFRRDPGIRWLDVEGEYATEAEALARAFLDR